MAQIAQAKIKHLKPGMHGDGGGLYLQVTGSAEKLSRSWIYRFTLTGKAREMGLGSYPALSLAEARERALQCRRMRDDGVDPIEARNKARQDAVVAAARSVTFVDAAEQYIAAKRAGWRNPKHGEQWTNTLATYAHPVFGDLSVQVIDTALVMKALDAIWTTKPETASRVRGRIEAVLDWAAVRGYRSGDNPARWRGHLSELLAPKSKVRAVQHHAAMPYSDVPAFLAKLRGMDAVSARSLEFVILTAARSGEVIGARWDEIDEAGQLWAVPGSRMKAGKEHRVPLSAPAMAVIERMKVHRVGDVVFPGAKAGKGLSSMAMDMALRRLGADITTHGFRSSFRDWAAERSSFPHEVCEMALAHTIGNKAEAAYRRGEMLEKRRKLMEAWAGFCVAQAAGGKVDGLGQVTGMPAAPDL